MCEALVELMRPEWDAAMEKAQKEGMAKGIERGMEKGIEQGMEKGIEEGQMEVARNLFLSGMDLEAVQNACSRIAVENLRKIQKSAEVLSGSR